MAGDVLPEEVFRAEQRRRRRRHEEALKRWRRREARQFLLEGLRREHAATGNPLCVWYAWRMCRGEDAPMDLPDWVLAYMDQFAATLRTWVDGEPPAGNLARAAGSAPGKKDENPLTGWRGRREGERWFAAFEALLDQGLSPSAAIFRVADGHNSSEPTVRRRLESFAATFGTTAEELAGDRRRLWERWKRSPGAPRNGAGRGLPPSWRGDPSQMRTRAAKPTKDVTEAVRRFSRRLRSGHVPGARRQTRASNRGGGFGTQCAPSNPETEAARPRTGSVSGGSARLRPPPSRRHPGPRSRGCWTPPWHGGPSGR
jgi:hypothetical protein